MIKKLTLTLILLLISISAYAQVDNLNYSGYVNDFAGVLSANAGQSIASIASELEQKTTAQIAVVTVLSTKPLVIEQYAVELFEKWGIGQKGKDNGILILLALNDKKVRIETGYGLEGALPDAICSQIIYQIMIPEFKKNDYEKALILATVAVADLVAKEYNIELSYANNLPQGRDVKLQSPKARALKTLVYLILFILMFGMRSGLLFFWILGPTSRRRGGYWHGGGFGGGSSSGFGGGFGGFGGGFSGGGGASGGW